MTGRREAFVSVFQKEPLGPIVDGHGYEALNVSGFLIPLLSFLGSQRMPVLPAFCLSAVVKSR
jgi:hypothetical protein